MEQGWNAESNKTTKVKQQLEQTLNAGRKYSDVEVMWETTAEMISKTADKTFGKSRRKRPNTC